MDENGRRRWRWRNVPRLLALFALVASSGGCLGPKAVGFTRTRYNEAYRATNDEQLLLNIVRLRYADSPVFIDLPNITSQFEVAGIGGYAAGPEGGNNGPGNVTNVGFGNVSARDTPTLSYRPREGKDVAKALLTPLTADLFSVVNAGANPEQLLLLTLNDINDVPNAPRATIMIPQVPDDNTQFRRGVSLIAALLQRDAVELALGTTEEEEASSDPIPTQQIKGGDLLEAAKDGYVYRTRADGKATLLRREKGLILKLRPGAQSLPEFAELARVFRLTPGLTKYRVKSELTEEDSHAQPFNTRDVVYLNMRSIMQILVYLSKGVCVPEEHVISGVAPSTPNMDGTPYDWTRITRGLFFVSSQKHRPRDVEVAVHYRGYWFFIPKNDVNSRAALAIVEILSSLQESDRGTIGPLLTLPLGG